MTTQQLVDQVEEHEAAPAAERHDVPLRRNWRYQAMWSGAAASMLGTMVADTAYPLLLLAMTGSRCSPERSARSSSRPRCCSACTAAPSPTAATAG